MTLLVSPYHRNAVGEIRWLDMPAEHSDLAGVESTRQSFWGSPAVTQLGLTLVTTLAHSDIYAEGAALLQLSQEIELLKDYVLSASIEKHCVDKSRKNCADKTHIEQTYWMVRLSNIEAAIQVAKQHDGGVYIG